MGRRRKGIRRKLGIRLVLALAAVSLVLPAGAAAYTVSGDFTGGAAAASHQIVLHRDGSQAVPFDATPTAATSAASSSGGFDWADAMIGAGVALGLVALIGAGGFTVRNRRRIAAAGPAQG
jgi:hypothetical protein